MKLILKNPFKKKFIAVLAIIGIGIGIGAMVALGFVTDSVINGIDNKIHNSGIDMLIKGEKVNLTDPNIVFYGPNKPLNKSWLDTIKNTEGVDSVAGVYETKFLNKNMLVPINLIGMENTSLKYQGNITNGTAFNDDSKEGIISSGLAKIENKTVGDDYKIDDDDYKIVGIYEPDNLMGVSLSFITSLKNVQDYVQDSENLSNVIVKLKTGVKSEYVSKELKNEYGDNIDVSTSIADNGVMGEMISMLKQLSLAISLLALLIGGIGILNTMMMSVYERTREIGVLKAVGWKNKRIITMVLGESLVLTMVASIIGTILGILLSMIVLKFLMDDVSLVFSINTILQAVIFAIIIGLVGGFYPAHKASKLPPTEALRYE
ncbi:MAG: ABC transporter permease [Methanobrevibacter sp.]|jgi:putative ABC transport system permease protein|nr:ABC transporter permease [Methanobrevibacter sp.]